jgi:coenzyme F420-0:L-glutamate ligase/coenzyme F420-1:gamma-L-glutamate ligase
MTSPSLTIFPVPGIPQVEPGDDLGRTIAEALSRAGLELAGGDVVVVTQKIVSKAEGRIVDLNDVKPSEFATRFAEQTGKDPRHVEVVLRESRRIVRMDRNVLITETRHGFVCANAGVDESNVGGGRLTLLPVDSDQSARAIRDRLRELTGQTVAVIISDTFGRPWREGLTDVALGVAGINPLQDYIGQRDRYGYELKVSVVAVADELASAAELALGKTTDQPVAVIRGYAYPAGDFSSAALIRDPGKDLFR